MLTKKRLLRIAIFLILPLIGVIALWIGTSWGIGTDRDSAVYILAAKNLADGKGLNINDPSGKTIPLIGQLTGEIHSDDILEDIFSRFCVGK